MKEISKGKLTAIIVFGAIAVASTLYYSISNILFYNKTGQLAGVNYIYGTYGNVNNEQNQKKTECLNMLKKVPARITCNPYYNEFYGYKIGTSVTRETYSSSTKKLFVLLDVMYDHTNTSTMDNSIERSFYAIQSVSKNNDGSINKKSQTYENDSSSNQNYRSIINTDFLKSQMGRSDVTQVAHFHTHPYISYNVQMPSPPDFDLETEFQRDGIDTSKLLRYVVTKDYVIQYWVDKPLTRLQISRLLNFSFVTLTYYQSFGKVCFDNANYVDDPTTTADDQLFCQKLSERENVKPENITDAYSNMVTYRRQAYIFNDEKPVVKLRQSIAFLGTLGLRVHVWTKDEFKRLTIQNGFYPDARPR